MIDFDALVLGPCVDIFARPITVTPAASQPERHADDGVTLIPRGAPYEARGIWVSRPVDVPTDGPDGIISSQNHTLDVRAADFEVAPIAGDYVEIPAEGSLPAVGRCRIEDIDEDGQGGLTLSLKVLDDDEDYA